MLETSSIVLNSGGACAMEQVNCPTSGRKLLKTWSGWSRRCLGIKKNTPAKRGLHLVHGLIVVFLLACVSASASGQQPAPQKKISVVIDDNYPPYVFRDNAGVLQGIIIDQWQAWEKKTGITAEVHGMDWAVAIERMKAGEFDVIDTVFVTA